MTNIMLEGGKEIDLLAVNPLSGEKYHIEVRIATRGFRLRLIDTQTRKGQKHKRGLDTLNAIKFAHLTVINAMWTSTDGNAGKDQNAQRFSGVDSV